MDQSLIHALYYSIYFEGGKKNPPLLYLTIMPLLFWRVFAPLAHTSSPNTTNKRQMFPITTNLKAHSMSCLYLLTSPPFSLQPGLDLCLNSSLAYHSHLVNPHNSFQAIPSSTFPLPNPIPVPTASHCINPTASQFISHGNISKCLAYKCQIGQNIS